MPPGRPPFLSGCQGLLTAAMVTWPMMMKQILALLAAAVVCAGCAANVEQAQDRLEPLIRQAIHEKRQLNDQQFERWRLYGQLRDAAGCNLSKGAIEREATAEERAELDALEC